jgi:hypothetical protein
MCRIGIVSVIVTTLLTSTVSAQVFLVGAAYYSSNNAGQAGGVYRYTTNSSDGALVWNINGNGKGISIPLNLGVNNFTFSVLQSFTPGPFGGLSLFFNATGVSYNPSVLNALIPGDLAAFTPTNNDPLAFQIPSAGTLIANYNPTGGNQVAYSGATSFQVGGYDVSISSFGSTTTPSGSFSLTVVAAVPEPSSWILIGTALVGGTSIAVKRWRFKRKRKVARS